jgi:hypothetical protein
MAQSLRDGGIGDSGGRGEIGDADRARGVDAAQQGQACWVAEQTEAPSPLTDGRWFVEGGDGLADPFAVDDTLIGSFRRQQVHMGIIAYEPVDK